MPIEVHERLGSPQITRGKTPRVERDYAITGTADEAQAVYAVEAITADAYDINDDGSIMLPREAISPRQVGDDTWEATVVWSQGPQPDVPDIAFDFQTETKHIVRSIATRRYPTSDTINAPDLGNMIGVGMDGKVEGCDVPVPAMKWTETWTFTDDEFNDDYKLFLDQHGGMVNSATWRRFAAGEVKFTPGSGRRLGDGTWQVPFTFEVHPNRSDVLFRNAEDSTGATDITVELIKGWEYVWERTIETTRELPDGTVINVPKLLGIYVEQVLYDFDFALLGIG